MAIPERLRWAVETLDVQPDDRILEIGCGRGVAVQLIGDKLTTGTVTGIDRSATMIEFARRRVNSERATLLTRAIEDGVEGVYDKVFAVNVNLFWTRSPARELDLIKALLAPAGALYLFYDRRVGELGEAVGAALTDSGFAVTVTAKPSLLCVRGRR